MSAKPKNPMRPKQKAAAKATGVAAALAYVARKLGVPVDDAPPEVWIVAAGVVTTTVAWLKRDGLRPAWERIVNGPRRRQKKAAND